MTTQYYNPNSSCDILMTCQSVGKTDTLKRDKILLNSGTYSIQRVSGDILGTVTISITGLVANSRVRIYNSTRATELYNAVVAGTSLSTTVNYYGGSDTINVRVTYVNGATAKNVFEQNIILSANGASILVTQTDNDIYNANAIDGSTVTEFIADYPNVQSDVNDPDDTTSVQRLYAWIVNSMYTADGIRYYFSAITAFDTLNYQINVSKVNLLLDNITTGPARTCSLTGGSLTRSDGSSPFVPAGIGKATFNPVTHKYYGSATTIAPPAEIRQEMDSNSTKLAHLDVDVSTRASQSSVDAIPTAGENANAVWDELLSGHTTAGSAGKTLKNTLSTNKFIGLK